jgi:hypothetical protein
MTRTKNASRNDINSKNEDADRHLRDLSFALKNNSLTFPRGLAIFEVGWLTSKGFQSRPLAFPIRSHSLVNQ